MKRHCYKNVIFCCRVKSPYHQGDLLHGGPCHCWKMGLREMSSIYLTISLRLALQMRISLWRSIRAALSQTIPAGAGCQRVTKLAGQDFWTGSEGLYLSDTLLTLVLLLFDFLEDLKVTMICSSMVTRPGPELLQSQLQLYLSTTNYCATSEQNISF